MIINPAAAEAAFYAFDLSFKNGLQAVNPLWQEVAEKKTSATREQRYVWVASIAGFRPWKQGTDRVYNNLAGRAYILGNNHYENSVEVGGDDINDDQLGIYSDSMRLLGVNAGAQPDQLLWTVVEAGLTTGQGYDGVPFFSTSHPVSLDNPGLGTYSNYFSGRVLNAANFAYVRAQLQGRKLENGLPMALGKLTLTVPPALRTTAEQILNLGMFAPATAYGAVAAQASDNILRGAANIVVSPYLTSDTRWFVTAELGGMRPFIFQERQPCKFVPLVSPTDANVFNLNVLRYGADVRNAAGYSLPQLAVCADA